MSIKITPRPDLVTRGEIWISKVSRRGVKWSTLDIEHERYNVCKRGGKHGAQLSPMNLGPVIVKGKLYAHNIEDAWQCSKVSFEHVNILGEPSKKWYKDIDSLRLDGQGLRRRYPKETPIAYSRFNGRNLNYVDARNSMYIPWYNELARKTDAYKDLLNKHLSGINLLLLEYDAPFSPIKLNTEYLKQWRNDKHKIFGHGAVLAQMLLNAD